MCVIGNVTANVTDIVSVLVLIGQVYCADLVGSSLLSLVLDNDKERVG